MWFGFSITKKFKEEKTKKRIYKFDGTSQGYSSKIVPVCICSFKNVRIKAKRETANKNKDENYVQKTYDGFASVNAALEALEHAS